MAKHECLTISKSLHRHNRTHIETITYEMLGTSPNGDVRIIDVIESTKLGRKTTYRYQHREMELPAGKYVNDYTWQSYDKGNAERTIKEWATLPGKQTMRQIIGSTVHETRYLK